jgi:hypothetical protein
LPSINQAKYALSGIDSTIAVAKSNAGRSHMEAAFQVLRPRERCAGRVKSFG